VARANAANQEEMLNLTDILLEGGRGNALGVARTEAQLNSTLATIPPCNRKSNVRFIAWQYSPANRPVT
jgi:hypothetical protein